MVLLQLQQSPIWKQSHWFASVSLARISVFEERKIDTFRNRPPKLANFNKFIACAYAIKIFSQRKKVRRVFNRCKRWKKNTLSTFVTLISIYHHLVTKIGASTAARAWRKPWKWRKNTHTTMRKQRFQSNRNRIHHNREIILGNFDKIYYYSRWSLHCFYWMRVFFFQCFVMGRSRAQSYVHTRSSNNNEKSTRINELTKPCKTHLKKKTTINEYFAGYSKYIFTSIHGIKSYENYKFVIFSLFRCSRRLEPSHRPVSLCVIASAHTPDTKSWTNYSDK